MRYRLLLEFECDGLAEMPTILSDLAARLEGVPVVLYDLRRADTRSVMESVADAPSEADVVRYFKEISLPPGVNAFDEAMRFYNFNKASGWKRAFEWKALARAWVARIRVGSTPPSSAQSFDVDEFFEAAVAASMKNENLGG